MSYFQYKKRGTLSVGVSFLIIISCLFFVIRTEAKTLQDRPDIKTDESVTISVDLQNESRFLGIDVYQIAEYRDGEFLYTKTYEALSLTPYRKLSSKSEIADMGNAVASYIKEERIKPTATIQCKKGMGEVGKLPVGVYLLMQNDDDCNASLNTVTVVEAPTWSDETGEYLYELHEYPKWERVIWFSFRPEVVYPLLRVCTLVLCVLLCIVGARLLRNALFIGSALFCGFIGMKMGEEVNASFMALMLFFGLFAFLGLGFMQIILMIIRDLIKRDRLYRVLQKKQFWIMPVIGAGLFSCLIYLWFAVDIRICITIFGLLALLGTYLQYIRKDEQIIFHTYDDLLRLKRADENDTTEVRKTDDKTV